MRLRTSPKSLLKTVGPRTNASVPRFTSANRSSKTFPIVSVSTSVPDMNATPSMTASAVVSEAELLGQQAADRDAPHECATPRSASSDRAPDPRSGRASRRRSCRRRGTRRGSRTTPTSGRGSPSRSSAPRSVTAACMNVQDLGARAAVEVAGGLVGEDRARAGSPARGRRPLAAAGRRTARSAGASGDRRGRRS